MTEREKQYWARIGKAMEEKHREARVESLEEAFFLLDDLDRFSQSVSKHWAKIPPPHAENFYQLARKLGKLKKIT